MKQLSEVLKNTKPMQGQTIQNANTSNTLVHGLITGDGRTSTQLPVQPNQANQPQETTSKQQSGECFEQKTPISECQQSKGKLTLLVKSCYDSLNTYGKDPKALESVTMLMQMTLGRFDYETVRAAFGTYIQRNHDMPKPADIINIIEPQPTQRKFCATTFIDIKRRKREGQFVTDSEERYCSEFIQAKINGTSEERIIAENAISQVAAQDKGYWLE